MPDFDLRLNPKHDAAKLAKEYAKKNYILVENIFPPDVAEAIHSVLIRGTPWHIVHSDEIGKHKYHTQTEWKNLAQDKQRSILSGVYKRAQIGFAYVYYVFPMIDTAFEPENRDWPLHEMTRFLNSDEFREFVKIITGEPSVLKLDAQATFYGRGHFLNTHDDTGDDQERRAAYVMGFTKGWRPDWGGNLMFLNSKNQIVSGASPSFNSLALFKVPKTHLVTQVSSFAGAPRLSITGWLRDDPLPNQNKNTMLTPNE